MMPLSQSAVVCLAGFVSISSMALSQRAFDQPIGTGGSVAPIFERGLLLQGLVIWLAVGRLSEGVPTNTWSGRSRSSAVAVRIAVAPFGTICLARSSTRRVGTGGSSREYLMEQHD